MLFNLTPSVELTGGPWFTDNELDTEFIRQLLNAVLTFIKGRSFPKQKGMTNALFPVSHTSAYPTAAQIANWIKKANITPTELDVGHINTLLAVLEYDGEIQALPASSSYDEDSRGGRVVNAAAASKRKSKGGDSDSDDSEEERKKEEKAAKKRREDKKRKVEKERKKAEAKRRRKKEEKRRKRKKKSKGSDSDVSMSGSDSSSGASSDDDSDSGSGSDSSDGGKKKSRSVSSWFSFRTDACLPATDTSLSAGHLVCSTL